MTLGSIPLVYLMEYHLNFNLPFSLGMSPDLLTVILFDRFHCLMDNQCCQNVLYLKYYTLFWQSLRIILYLYCISVKYFINTLLWHEIV